MSWFVAHTKPRCEFKAKDYFEEIGIEAYVPSIEEKKEWSGRIKKTRVPAISGYLFFELQQINYDYVNLNPFLKNVVRRFGKAVEVRNSEINAMKDCLKNYSDSFLCHNGDQVKILSGVFKNKIGLVDQIENSYLTLLVNSLKIKLSYNTTKLKVV